MLAPQVRAWYDLLVLSYCKILPRYVTWRCHLDLWPFDFGVISRDATFVFNPCTKIELDTTYRSRVRTTTIFHWPPILGFSWSKGGQISNFICLSPKGTTMARMAYNDVLRVRVCPEMLSVTVAKWPKKDRNFHASHWLFAQTTHVDVGPWNFACGVVSGKKLYISNFMKIGREVSGLWKVENRPLMLTCPMVSKIAFT